MITSLLDSGELLKVVWLPPNFSTSVNHREKRPLSIEYDHLMIAVEIMYYSLAAWLVVLLLFKLQ